MKLVTSNVINLFPSNVYKFHFEDYNKNELIKVVSNLKENLPSEKRSNYGGWQSPSIFDLPLSEDQQDVMLGLTEIIIQGIKHVEMLWNFDVISESLSPRIMSLWFNWNEKDSHNTLHHHGNTGYSGAFYIKKREDGEDGSIEFEDTRRDAAYWEVPRLLMYQFMPMSPDQFSNRKIMTKEGDLLIFPSYFNHRVTESNSEDFRVSASFNFNWFSNEKN